MGRVWVCVVTTHVTMSFKSFLPGAPGHRPGERRERGDRDALRIHLGRSHRGEAKRPSPTRKKSGGEEEAFGEHGLNARKHHTQDLPKPAPPAKQNMSQ